MTCLQRIHLFEDLCLGLRLMMKRPLSTAVSVVTLALGVGFSIAVYTTINGMILHPVAGWRAHRLMEITQRHIDERGNISSEGIPATALRDLRSHEAFSELAWSRSIALETRSDGFRTGVRAQIVSPNFFNLLGVRPTLGRTFGPGDALPLDHDSLPEKDSVIILSEDFWKRNFSGETGVLGKTIVLSGCRFTVVGVLPAHFQFPRVLVQVWITAADPRLPTGRDPGPQYEVLTLLKEGTDRRQAQAALEVMPRRLLEGTPQDRGAVSVFSLHPLAQHFPRNPGADQLHRALFGLFAAIGFVLLIVCANLASLTLAQSEARGQEWAIRAALGASPRRIVMHILTESLMLSFMGGVAALVVASWSLRLLVLIIPQNYPQLRPIEAGAPALWLALLLSVIVGIACGFGAALRARRSRPTEEIKRAGAHASSSRSIGGFREILVVTQVALALVLLTGAGLMIQTVSRLLQVDPGFDPQNLLFVSLWLPEMYGDSDGSADVGRARELRNDLFRRLHDQLSAIPGLEAVGIYGGGLGNRKFRITGRVEPVELPGEGCGVAENDLFRAIRAPLLAGRFLNQADIGEKATAVLISQAMARLCWPGQDALGKSFSDEDASTGRTYEVVGVVSDLRLARYAEAGGPRFYRPCQSVTFEGLSPAAMLAIRTADSPQRFIPAIREALRHTDPELWQPRIKVVSDTLYNSTRPQRIYMLYLATFGSVGLLLSALGIYAVLTLWVARRTREIGIRAALGGQRSQILRMVLVQGAKLIAIGLGCGLLGAYWITQFLRSQLFGVNPNDPIVLAAVISLLALTGLLACFFPALRAARISCTQALRSE